MQKKNDKNSVLKLYAPINSGGRVNFDESDFKKFSQKGVPQNLLDEWCEENDFWGLDLRDPERCALLVNDIEVKDFPKMIEIFLAQEESKNKLAKEKSKIHTKIQKDINDLRNSNKFLKGELTNGKETIQNQELRRQMFKMGEDDAITFLETLKET